METVVGSDGPGRWMVLNLQENPSGIEGPKAVDVASEPMTRRMDRSLAESVGRGGADGFVAGRYDAAAVGPLPPLV